MTDADMDIIAGMVLGMSIPVALIGFTLLCDFINYIRRKLNG